MNFFFFSLLGLILSNSITGSKDFLSKLTYTKLSDESLNKCENIEYFYLENSIQLRYIISDKFWKANGPILFYASENVDVNLICQQISPIWSQAEKLEALVVFAEQRKEKNNPIVLSSDQILANYKLLINHIKTKTPGAQQSSVIMFKDSEPSSKAVLTAGSSGSRYYQSPYGTVDPYGGYKYKIENSYQKYPSYVPSSKGYEVICCAYDDGDLPEKNGRKTTIENYANYIFSWNGCLLLSSGKTCPQKKNTACFFCKDMESLKYDRTDPNKYSCPNFKCKNSENQQVSCQMKDLDNSLTTYNGQECPIQCELNQDKYIKTLFDTILEIIDMDDLDFDTFEIFLQTLDGFDFDRDDIDEIDFDINVEWNRYNKDNNEFMNLAEFTEFWKEFVRIYYFTEVDSSGDNLLDSLEVDYNLELDPPGNYGFIAHADINKDYKIDLCEYQAYFTEKTLELLKFIP